MHYQGFNSVLEQLEFMLFPVCNNVKHWEYGEFNMAYIKFDEREILMVQQASCLVFY